MPRLFPDTPSRRAPSLIRAIRTFAAAEMHFSGDLAEAAAALYPGDRHLPAILRNAVSPTTVAGTPELAPTAIAEMLPLLSGASAGAALMARGLDLNLGSARSIQVPAYSPDAVGSAWTSEADPIRIFGFDTSDVGIVSLRRLKSAFVFTSELMRSSAAEAMISRIVTEGMAQTIDTLLFSADAATPVSSQGLLHNIVPTPATAGADVDLRTDISNLVAAVSGVGFDIVLIAPPRQAAAILLTVGPQFPFTVLASSSLTLGTVIAVAVGAFVSASGNGIQITRATDAVVVMSDPVVPFVDGVGTPASSTLSLFQSDLVGVKISWPTAWAMRSPSGVAFMSVNW